MTQATYFVKNVSDQVQSIVAIGSFDPGETKELSHNKTQRLLRNPNFKVVEAEPVLDEVKKTPKTGRNTQ